MIGQREGRLAPLSSGGGTMSKTTIALRVMLYFALNAVFAYGLGLAIAELTHANNEFIRAVHIQNLLIAVVGIAYTNISGLRF